MVKNNKSFISVWHNYSDNRIYLKQTYSGSNPVRLHFYLDVESSSEPNGSRIKSYKNTIFNRLILYGSSLATWVHYFDDNILLVPMHKTESSKLLLITI